MRSAAASEFDHVIERMHADRGEGAGRRLVGRRPPIVRRDELGGRGGVLRDHGRDCAEPAVGEPRPYFSNARMKPPGEADRKDQIRSTRRFGHGARTGKLEREGLFDEDMFVRRNGRKRLRLMQAVRRGEHDGIDVGVA